MADAMDDAAGRVDEQAPALRAPGEGAALVGGFGIDPERVLDRGAEQLTAPVRWMRSRIFSSRRAGTYRSSPASPIFTPSQNVSAAPAIDPAAASNTATQAPCCWRALSIMTTASMPKGNEKNIVASRAARTKTPKGDANSPTSWRLSECTP